MKLPLSSLGKLLRLAERYEKERMAEAKPLKESLEELRRETRQKVLGIFEGQSAERNLLVFLESLSEDEKRDVMALFYLGRHAGDDFESLRFSPSLSLDLLPHHLSDKRDLEPALIEGIKRLSS